jgi:heavy metal sensor kinase
VSRLPIRAKVTLAFFLVMVVVLAGAGIFLYLSLAASLDRTINQGLYTRAADVSALVREADSGLRLSGGSTLAREGENFAQIVDRTGRVFDATPGFNRRSLLSPAQLARAEARTRMFETVHYGDRDPARLLATPVSAQGKHLVVLVGTPLEDRIGTLNDMRNLLFIGGALALILASAAGYMVAAASLRPVERMRRRAETISGEQLGVRLPMPPANDEIRRLGLTLNAMLERLDLAVEHERDFVSDASHELRTPLAVLRTELEVSLRKSRTPEELEDALRSAHEETERLVQLSEDLLVLARIDRGRMPLNPGELEVRGLLNALRTKYEHRFERAGRALVTIAPAGLKMFCDPLRVEQAIANLLENALRHGAGTTSVTASRAERAVRLVVEDEGPGFPAEFLPRAFERFSRAAESRRYAGSGLGLAIVKSIVESHGGSARAFNAVGGGACVELEFPDAVTHSG